MLLTNKCPHLHWRSPSSPRPPPSSSSSSSSSYNRAQLRNNVSHQQHCGSTGERLHVRALLRVHRVLLGAALLQPHHQLDHSRRAAAPESRPLRAGVPPPGVRPGPPGDEQRLLLPDPPGRAAGALRLPRHDHGSDQQRLQHPADAHGDGFGPLLRSVPPDALHLRLHLGPLALAAGCAHLGGGVGDSPQSAPAPGLRRRGDRLWRGVWPGAAEERPAAEGAVHRSVHAAHTVQLCEDTGGGAAVGGGESAQPGRVQDDRAPREPAGGLHPTQFCELRADGVGRPEAHTGRDQGAVRCGRLCFL